MAGGYLGGLRAYRTQGWCISMQANLLLCTVILSVYVGGYALVSVTD